MPMSVKQLYMASNINELKEKSKCTKLQLKKENSVDRTIISFKKLYDNAVKLLKEEGDARDEEVAYMYLFRAMELWNLIKESTEFQQNTEYFKLMHGKTVVKILKQLEELNGNLIKRYNEKLNGKEDNVGGNLNDQFKVNTTSFPHKKRKEASDIEGKKNVKLPLALQITQADIDEIELVDNYMEPSVEDLPGNNST